MANALLAFPNYADDGYYATTLSGGLWQPNAPLKNLKDRYFANKARTINRVPENTKLVADLGVTRSVSVVVIPKSNLTKNGYAVISFYDASMATLRQDKVEPYPIIYPMGSVPFWHESFWDGKVTEENKSIYPFPILLVLNSAVTMCRYVGIEFYDSANPDGYLEFNRLFIAPGWQPSRNYSYGAKLGVTDPTIVSTSLGNADFYDQRTKRRVAYVEFPFIEQKEAFANALDMQMRLGVSGQVFFCSNPSDVSNLHRISFLATMSQLDPLTASAFNLQGASFSLREVVA